MSRNVKLTQTAETQLKNLLEYLETSWPQKVKSDFIKKLDNCISKISLNPNLFPRSFIKNGLHKCVVTKQTSLFYIHDKATITILTVFDTRQDPQYLSDQIKKDKT